MATIVTRAGKGSALTHAEGDANFTNLNTDKLENVSEDTTPTLGGELDANNNKIVNVTDPTSNQDAATKLYVDSTVAGAAVTSSTATILEVRNTTGTAIAKGVPVYIAGHSGTKILVAPADADDAAKMPAIGLMNATLSNNSDGEVISFGLLTGIDLSTFSIGDTLFVDTTPGGATFGGLTATKPTGETAAIQNLGKVARNVSNGEFIVSGPGRSNDVPNLDEDQFFLGNASNQAVAVDFSDAVEALSINNVLEDTTPQAGGDFDLNGNLLTDASGKVTIDGTNGVEVSETESGGSPTGNAVISSETGTNLFLVGDGGDFTATGSGYIQLTASGFANINKVGSGKVAINGYNMPDSIGTAGQVLTVDTQSNTTVFQDLDVADLIALDDLSVTTGSATSGGALAYNNATGVFTFQPADLSTKIALTNLSVTTAAAGSAALSYNNATGVFTFTPEDVSDLAALGDFSVTTGAASGAGALSYNNATGVFTFNPTDVSLVLANVSEDTTPQLGGNLDVNGNSIVSVTNGNIAIEPNGNGNVNITTDTGGINLSSLKSYDEMLKTDNSTTGTISLDHEAAPLHYIVQTGALTISGLTTPTAGANVTLILNNSGGSYTITFDETNSTFYAVDGTDPTLTGFDMFNILCIDDTTDAEVYIVTGVGSISAIT